jgi:hypothetical protein
MVSEGFTVLLSRHGTSHATRRELVASVGLPPTGYSALDWTRQSTSNEAPGLLAYVEHSLGAHHSPDVFHVQHELVKAVSGPMATKQRAAAKAASEAQERREQVQGRLQDAGDAPEKRDPGRPTKAPPRLEQVAQQWQAASQELERISAQREQVAQRIRGIGQAYHFVDRARGVRRDGSLIAADIPAHIDTIRTVAQHEGLSQNGLDRIEKAERVIPTMQATIECVSGSVRQQVSGRNLAPSVSSAMHAHLMPSFSRERVAQIRTVSVGEPLRELAEGLRTPLCEPGGALAELRESQQSELRQQAKELAEVFQRSSLASSYRALTGYAHDFVNHTKKEYAYGDMHENRAKCLFSLLKPYLLVFRGISKTNLPGYLGFFQFLRNFRQLTAYEQAELILNAALDPAIANQARKGDFVRRLDSLRPATNRYKLSVTRYGACHPNKAR